MTARYARIGLTAFLALYGIVLLRDPSAWSFLDAVDLAIHETGHLVFTPFGEVMHFLGGTLFQIIVPMAFVIEFARRGERHSASVCLWWVAQNCWNISVYVADARARALPLVGGGEHDWAFLLRRAGLMAQDQQLSRMIHFLGVVIFIASLAWGIQAIRAARRGEIAAEMMLSSDGPPGV